MFPWFLSRYGLTDGIYHKLMVFHTPLKVKVKFAATQTRSRGAILFLVSGRLRRAPLHALRLIALLPFALLMVYSPPFQNSLSGGCLKIGAPQRTTAQRTNSLVIWIPLIVAVSANLTSLYFNGVFATFQNLEKILTFMQA